MLYLHFNFSYDVVSYAIWQAMQFGTLPVILSIFIVIHFKKLYKNEL